MFRPSNLAATTKPWNKGKLLAQKHPLSLKQIWSIRGRLKIAADVEFCEIAYWQWQDD